MYHVSKQCEALVSLVSHNYFTRKLTLSKCISDMKIVHKQFFKIKIFYFLKMFDQNWLSPGAIVSSNAYNNYVECNVIHMKCLHISWNRMAPLTPHMNMLNNSIACTLKQEFHFYVEPHTQQVNSYRRTFTIIKVFVGQPSLSPPV